MKPRKMMSLAKGHKQLGQPLSSNGRRTGELSQHVKHGISDEHHFVQRSNDASQHKDTHTQE